MYQKYITNALSFHNNLVTITFFDYKGTNILWALKEMQLSKKPLSEVPGLNFFKILGSGEGDGFKKPDFKVYALVAVWKNRIYAKNFFRTSKIFRGFKDHSKEWWTLFMEPLRSKGKWSNINPFMPVEDDHHDDGPVAVLTRASISRKNLLYFWNSVTGVTEVIKEQDGIIFSKALGEYPLFQQATFSIWQNKRAVQLFAYHLENKTVNSDKNAEDLFTEFKIVDTQGSWNGINLTVFEEEKLRGEAVQNLIIQSLSENTKIIDK